MVVSVTSASVLKVVVPAMAESSSEVILLFTVSPHVPDNSPVTGSAKPKSDVYAVVMIKLLFAFYWFLKLLCTSVIRFYIHCTILQSYSGSSCVICSPTTIVKIICVGW